MCLDYEGPVSGDRGTVTQGDAGTFEWLVNGNDLDEVWLAGRRLIVCCSAFNSGVQGRASHPFTVWSTPRLAVTG